MAETRRLIRQRQHRRSQGRFVVETPKLVVEALGSGLAVDFVLMPSDAEAAPELIAAAESSGTDVFGIEPHVFDEIADTRSPQPALAVLATPALTLDDRMLGTGPARLLVLVDVADPGNVGTLIRTAEASGCRGVVATGATADLLSPKVVRSSSGSMLRLPLAEGDTEAVLDALDSTGITSIATTTSAEPYDEADLGGDRQAIVLGSEAHGLPEWVVDRCAKSISVPMAEPVESLNVATAGAIMAFELARRGRAR